MSQLVVLNLGSGNLDNGFPGIVAEVWDRENEPPIKLVGQLPACPTLLKSYYCWRSLYQSLQSPIDWRKSDTGFRITLESDDASNNISSSEFQELNQRLRQQLNIWLDSKGFRQLERRLRARLNSQAYIHIVIQTDDKVLRRLPWHLWNIFADCPNAEVGLSLPEYERPSVQRTAIGKVKILAVLGDSEGIDVEKDGDILRQLPNANVTVISKPTLQELTEYLWQEEGWDIFFFAGHSNTSFDEEKGYFSLSSSNRITIKQLVNSLRKAIKQGLQLAIFNSCDGLGLAKELAQLNIPQAIVMREPIPDLVAQVFVKNFLQTFAGGLPFYKSVREARERLEGFEEVFPCASWLPVVCQNPIHPPPTWLDLLRSMEPQRLTAAKSSGDSDSTDNLVTLVFTDLAQSTLIKSVLLGTDITEKNQVYYETILLPHRRYVERSIVDYGGRVVETEGDGHFLVFGSAVKAAQWAIQLQEYYHLHPIQTPLGNLEVRVGMHTGQPLKDGRGYSGQEVDFAARVGALADNGQILLSQMTAVLLRDSKTKGLDCYEHSPTFLKGIGSEIITELLYLDRSPHSPRNPQKPKLKNTAIIGSLAASLVVIAMRVIGLLQPAELVAFDQLMRLRP
ncbi:MAG: CHAT domain-containing protein, partial [Limnothrix sp. RL_2_0]|nr:CHAT domain-containing protein [Limnothrix sp. RL_2_0]